MTNRVAHLGKPSLPTPPAVGNLRAHHNALAQHVHSMFQAQDRTLTPGRRVVLELGMRGSPYHENTDQQMQEGDFPTPGYSKDGGPTVCKLKDVQLTPGHVLRFEARCLPSGQTRTPVFNISSGNNEANLSGDTGRVKLIAVFQDGVATETITRYLQFDAEPSEYGHGVDMPGAGFGQLQEKWAFAFPTSMLFDTDEVVEWSQNGITVDLRVSYLGGIRPVDVTVYEVPYKIARVEGVTAGPAHIYQNWETVLDAFPFEYPIEGASSGDRRFGSQHALNVAKASQDQTGPVILSLSRQAGVTRPVSSEPAPFSVTSTSFAPLDYTAPAGGEEPSFDFSSGSFGRSFRLSSEDFALTDRGVCRVKITVNWKAPASRTITMRAKTADHSYVEMSTTSTSYTESECIADLECGQTVLDSQQLDLHFKMDSASTGSVLYVQVQHMPG